MTLSILISAFIGSENLGDEAIFRSILDNLGIDKAQITALSVNQEKTRKLGVRTRSVNSPVNIIRAIRECDVLLMGGGGIIQDLTSMLNLLNYLFQIAVARYYGKPVFLCFVGVDRIRSPLNRYLLERLGGGISYAVVRDAKSKDILSQYMDADRIMVAHDPVLNFVFRTEQLLASPYQDRKPYIVISARRWFYTNILLPVVISRRLNKLGFFRGRYDRFIKSLAGDIDAFLEKHPEITAVLVSCYDSEDIDVLHDLQKMMRTRGRVVLAKNKMSEFEYLSIVSGSLFVLGMRLHALILGAAANKPFVALRYSPKVTEFTEQFGLMDYSVSVEDYDSEQLLCNLDRMVQQAAALEPKVKAVLSGYQQTNREAFSRLRESMEAVERAGTGLRQS